MHAIFDGNYIVIVNLIRIIIICINLIFILVIAGPILIASTGRIIIVVLTALTARRRRLGARLPSGRRAPAFGAKTAIAQRTSTGR
jgi:hypothetical protein